MNQSHSVTVLVPVDFNTQLRYLSRPANRAIERLQGVAGVARSGVPRAYYPAAALSPRLSCPRALREVFDQRCERWEACRDHPQIALDDGPGDRVGRVEKIGQCLDRAEAYDLHNRYENAEGEEAQDGNLFPGANLGHDQDREREKDAGVGMPMLAKGLYRYFYALCWFDKEIAHIMISNEIVKAEKAV